MSLFIFLLLIFGIRVNDTVRKFADGLAYSKAKLEEAYRNGLLEKPVKPPKGPGGTVKKDDVELIVSDSDLTRPPTA